MGKSIGRLLEALRKEKDCSLAKLSKGICNPSELSKVEMNAVMPDCFRLDRLIERLGSSTERLEYMLSRESYELYELRYKIQTAILYRNLEAAEGFLEIYEKKKCSGKVLHRQFIEQERAQIAWLKGEKTEIVLQYLNTAIEQTMPLKKAVESGMALSAEELKLLAFRWEVSFGTEFERSIMELWILLDYLNARQFVAEEKVKIYPYVVLLLLEHYDVEKNRSYCLELIEEALELLRDEGRLLYMTEILELYVRFFQEEEKACKLRGMRETLLELEEECGVHFEKFRLFQHINRTFELDYEVIRKSRLTNHMSQEELCEGICTQEALSRIETGKTKANQEILGKLLDRMNRKRNRVGMFVNTERYEVIALEREIVRCRQRFQYEKAEALLKEIKEKLDMSVLENQQYILKEQIETDVKKSKMPEEEAVRRLEEILRMTLEYEEGLPLEYRLTHVESNILNKIAILLCDINEDLRAEKIWNALVENYEESDLNVVFNIRNWELMIGNHASTFLDLEIPNQCIKECQKRLKITFEAGKGNGVGRTLTLIACALEQQKNDMCKKRFSQALQLLELMKMEYRYRCVKEYVEERGLQE